MDWQDSLYAVLTGDVVGSSKVPGRRRPLLLNYLKGIFRNVEESWPGAISKRFEIYRGDSFQVVLSDPSAALCIAIFLRASLRKGFPVNDTATTCDARIAIGIGAIDFLPESTAEGDGEAFHRSGRLLDGMRFTMFAIATPVKDVDEELNTELSLLDAIIGRWSSPQAEAVCYSLRGLSNVEIAGKLGISAAAVGQRLVGANLKSVDRLLDRFEKIVRVRVTAGTSAGLQLQS